MTISRALLYSALAILATEVPALAQAPAARADGQRTDWPMYRGDAAGTGFSSVAQITPANVATLTRSWSYSLAGGTRAPASQATPIVVGGVMYLPVADGVAAIDPTTGTEIWRRPITGQPSRRGVTYWPGGVGRTAPRIFVMAANRLIALDAGTGEPVAGFGTAGEVDIGVPYNSVPFVYDDVVVVGANTPPGAAGGVGNARAFSALSGAKLWEFSSVPQPGQVGHDTWEADSWRDRTGANAWPFYFTMDEAREILYLPLASPLPFGYGGDRAGANLFANSVVAVNVRTGEYVWHFQTIHHDLWDHDPPAPPVLFDIPAGAATIPALGVTTKSGYLYILNRVTGVPVYGVEERPVPQSQVPGEKTYPTQPFPVRTPPLARVSYSSADLVTADDTSPEHAAMCQALVAGLGELRNDGPFTPWNYRAPGAAPVTTLLFPGMVGGFNWGGMAYDPGSERLIGFSQDIGWLGWVQEAPNAPLGYDRASPRPSTFDVAIGGTRLPCQKPPWGQVMAVDATTGNLSWRRPVGITEGLPPGRQVTGRPGRAGAIVTASGLLFIAATDDARFRALDVDTGAELWVEELEAVGNANPMTYLGRDGKQYVVIVATDRVVSFTLP